MKANAVAAALAALTSLASASVRADADTLAFYTFTEGADGDSAVGTAILNGVDASRFAGTADVNDNGETPGANDGFDIPVDDSGQGQPQPATGQEDGRHGYTCLIP